MRGWWHAFVVRHPLFVTAMLVAACVALADEHLWMGLAAGLAVGWLGWFSGSWKRGVSWALLGGLAVAVFALREKSDASAGREMLGSRAQAVVAVAQSDPKGGNGFWMVPARIREGRWRGTEVWWHGRGPSPVAGSILINRGEFKPIEGPRNPGEFDRAAWLRRQGIVAEFHGGWREDRVETGALAALGARVRLAFRNAVTAGLEEDSIEARVIRAVVIGETPPESEDLIAAFRNSGTLHVFSVSGLHVAMVGGIGWFLLGWLGVPRRWAVPLLLPLIFGYSWITGNSAPAVRSAWMAAVFLGAFVSRRKPDLLNALGAVLLGACLWDGRLLFQPGVQLSYGVVAAIAVGTRWATRTFSWMTTPELHLPDQLMSRWQKAWLSLRQRAAQSLGVSLSAGVGSAPLTVYHFGVITPVSMIANLLLVPMVFGLLVVALLGTALSPVPPVARFVNRVNGGIAKLTVKSAEAFSAIPGGHYQIGRETRPTLLVFDLGYGAGSSVFSAGDGAVLIDCGEARSFRRTVAPSLKRLGIEPDSVVISHPDGGHLGGGAQVWEALPVRQCLLPVKLSRSPAFRTWVREAPKAGITVHQAENSPSLAFPDHATLEVLLTPDPDAQNTIADDRVAVFRLHWRGWRILFTNDAGLRTERALLETGKDVGADLIIAGRHRSDLSLGDPFLNAVDPLAIVASNGNHPPSERLPESTSAYWKSRGIAVFDQAKTGGVTVRIDEEGNLRISGFLGQEAVLRKR